MLKATRRNFFSKMSYDGDIKMSRERQYRLIDQFDFDKKPYV
jgi:hypothetical protein